MSPRKTAVVAKPLTSTSAAPYVDRARMALPLLVQQASARQPVTYEELARALHMPNARNLNYVLGSIGSTLEALSTEWNERLPPIQSLVVTKATHLPGVGFDSSGQVPAELRRASPRERRRIVDALWAEVFRFPRWPEVLAALTLVPATTPALPPPPGHGGCGEGPAHMAFKNHIAASPQLLGLDPSAYRGQTEYCLPTGDRIDVLFTSAREWVAVEVKAHTSDPIDQQRGVFQCIKYDALVRAVLNLSCPHVRHRVLLVCETAVPDSVATTARLLGVTLQEGNSTSETG